jgi:hypothetical protein
VELPDLGETYPTISLNMSEEFAWGTRDTVYDIEVTRLYAEGEDIYGVQILNEGVVVVSPKSPTWWRIFRSYLEWKANQEYEDDGLEETKLD